MTAAYAVRFGLKQRIPVDFAVLMAVAPVIWVGTFLGFRLYSIQHFAPADEFRRIVAASAISIMAMAVISFWAKESFSRVWIGLAWAFATMTVLVERQLWHKSIGRMRTDGRLTYATLVIGTNEEAARLAQAMRSPDLGHRPIGCVRTGRD